MLVPSSESLPCLALACLPFFLDLASLLKREVCGCMEVKSACGEECMQCSLVTTKRCSEL